MLRRKEGFTLVELLIVVAIIGILAAIAIPQFAAYRAKAYCSAAKSDLANLAISQEAYFTDYSAYFTGNGSGVTSAGAAAVAVAFSADPADDFIPSKDVTVVTTGVAAAAGAPASFTATATHAQCPQGSTVSGSPVGTFAWDSTAGGLQP